MRVVERRAQGGAIELGRQADLDAGIQIGKDPLVSDATDTSWRETNTAFDALTPIVPSLEQVPTGDVIFGELVVENIQEESSYIIAVAAAP